MPRKSLGSVVRQTVGAGFVLGGFYALYKVLENQYRLSHTQGYFLLINESGGDVRVTVEGLDVHWDPVKTGENVCHGSACTAAFARVPLGPVRIAIHRKGIPQPLRFQVFYDNTQDIILSFELDVLDNRYVLVPVSRRSGAVTVDRKSISLANNVDSVVPL